MIRRWLALWTAVLLVIVAIVQAPIAASSGALPAPSRQATPPVPIFAPKIAPPSVAPTSCTGFVPPPMDLSHLKGDRMPDGVGVQSLLPRFDWRELGVVSPVKNQGNCGSCYSFGAIAAIESKVAIDGGGITDFSENNAKECNWEAQAGWGTGSCGGGNSWMMTHLFSILGTALESCDPYVAADVACSTGCPYQTTVLGWGLVSGGGGGELGLLGASAVPDTSVLKAYLQTYGPLMVSMYAGDSLNRQWENELKGYEGAKTLYYPGTQQPNHAVLLVGWDDGLSHAGGTGGWIVKNSWGTNWGGTCGYGSERGYFKIAYGSASIGSNASFFYALQDYDPSGNIMYYDEAGWNQAVGYDDTTAWGLSKFFPPKDTWVTRIEFWTTDVTTDVDVYIYNGFSGHALSDLLFERHNLSFAEAGYHSVLLDTPLRVTQGNDVIAVVKFTNSEYGLPVAVDIRGATELQRTYISPVGASGTWADLGTGGADAAIRLRTSDSDGATPTPTATLDPSGYNVYLPVLLRNYDPDQLLQNRGFDTGTWTPWDTYGSPELTDQVYRSASYSARLAGRNDVDSDYVVQAVMVPSDASVVTVDFWYRVSGNDASSPEDYMCAEILDSQGATVLVPLFCYELYLVDPQEQWLNFRRVISGTELAPLLGQTVLMSFQGWTNATNPSTIWVDDVSFHVTGAGS